MNFAHTLKNYGRSHFAHTLKNYGRSHFALTLKNYRQIFLHTTRARVAAPLARAERHAALQAKNFALTLKNYRQIFLHTPPPLPRLWRGARYAGGARPLVGAKSTTFSDA